RESLAVGLLAEGHCNRSHLRGKKRTADAFPQGGDPSIVTRAQSPAATAWTPLFVRASFLHGGQHAIAGGKGQVLDAEQTGQVLKRAKLAVRQFSERRRAVLHR